MDSVLSRYITKGGSKFDSQLPLQHEIVSSCPQQQKGTNLCGYYVCRHMISICKSADCCNDATALILIIFKLMTPEPLPAGELLVVRSFISNFFLKHYIKPTEYDEDFSMPFPPTVSMHSASVRT